MKKAENEAMREKEAVIFEAALKTIKEKGLHKARMSDIASAAGISYGLVYHYFRNKEDLFDAILSRWWGGLFQVVDAFEGKDLRVHHKLRRIIQYFLDTYQHRPEMVNIFITEVSRSTTNLTRHRLDYFKKWMARTESIMLEGQKRGLLRNDFKARYLTYIFLGALEAFLSTMVLAGQNISGNRQKERIAESILEVFLNGAKASGKTNTL
jgi:TetR/AcrR family fatty acid metabolism transcriptional regulator